jgi:hypothetical protein
MGNVNRISVGLLFEVCHFQMALIPLTMSRFSIASLSRTVLDRSIQLNRAMRIHVFDEQSWTGKLWQLTNDNRAEEGRARVPFASILTSWAHTAWAWSGRKISVMPSLVELVKVRDTFR